LSIWEQPKQRSTASLEKSDTKAAKDEVKVAPPSAQTGTQFDWAFDSTDAVDDAAMFGPASWW
jgi:hypothetical protein